MLWRTQAVLLDVRNQVPNLICEERCDTDDAANSNGQESETRLAKIEMVDGRVDEWEDLERRIVNAVDQSSLQEVSI